MSITLDANAAARIVNSVRGAVWLVEMFFTSGTIRFTNSPINLTINSVLYTAYGNLVSVSALNESESNSSEKLTLSFSVVDQAMLALCLGNVDSYRGKSIRLYMQLMDDRFQPEGAPIRRWSGYMDKVQVQRSSPGSSGGASMGSIDMQCSRAGMARARNFRGLRLTNTQQQQRFPGDRGLEYLQNLIEQPARWLSKRFQEI